MSQCVKIVFLQIFGLSKWGFQKEISFFVFSFFYVGEIETKKKKMEETKKTYKIEFFKVVIQICEKSKNGFLAKIVWHYLCQEGRKNAHFRCTLSVLAKIFFWTKTVQNKKHYQNRGFSGNCRKTIMTPFFLEKGVFFDMVEKVGFTNCVFEKLCFPENIIFIVFSAKHSFSKTKTVCWKTENLWKIVGCFWTWQNGVFWVCFLRF